MAATTTTSDKENIQDGDDLEDGESYCDVCSLRLGRDTCGPLCVCIRCLRTCCAHCHRLYMALTDITEHEYCDICRERDLEGRDLIMKDTTTFHNQIYLCPYCDCYFLDRGPGLCGICDQFLRSQRDILGAFERLGHPEPNFGGKTITIVNNPNNIEK